VRTVRVEQHNLKSGSLLR